MFVNYERSCLFNIQPIGQNTPYIESLTSYINRLADVHFVNPGILFNKLYVPLLNTNYLIKITYRGGNGFFDDFGSVNGIGKNAVEIKKITEKLTGRSDLLFNTLLIWKDLLPVRGLLRKSKAWCSICYEEMKQNNQDPFDPLIWSITASTFCSKHHKAYEEICPFCKKTIPFFTRKGKIGYCSNCHGWLGNKSSEISLCKINNYELKTNKLLEEMICFNSNEVEISKENLIISIKKCIEILFDNLNDFTRVTGIPRSTIMGWLELTSVPPLKSLLFLCTIFNLNVEQLLKQDLKNVSLAKEIDIKKYYNKEIRKEQNHDLIKEYLIDIINKKKAISLSKIALKFSCDRKLLSRRYPSECRIIIKISQDESSRKKNKRKNLKIKQLQTTFYFLLKSNTYPSRRKIEYHLVAAFLKENFLNEEWKRLKNKHLL
jgi:TniQ